MSELITKRVHTWLKRYNRGEVQFPQHLIDDYITNTTRRLSEVRKQEFRLRMSNLGKPLCQLQQESRGTERHYVNEYQRMYTFMAGDTGEQWLIMVLKAAGVNVEGVNIPAELMINGQLIKGTADIQIDGGIWDIKTMSHMSFQKYVDFGGFKAVEEDDPFGYVTQGFLYGKALGLPFRGWIIINKSNGNIAVSEVPVDYQPYEDAAFAEAEQAVGTILDGIDNEIMKLPLVEEKFKKKPTGNIKLCKTCSWCDYKDDCWPDRIRAPAAFSIAAKPPMVEYIELNYTKDD